MSVDSMDSDAPSSVDAALDDMEVSMTNDRINDEGGNGDGGIMLDDDGFSRFPGSVGMDSLDDGFNDASIL
jgi:hypothetical protein